MENLSKAASCFVPGLEMGQSTTRACFGTFAMVKHQQDKTAAECGATLTVVPGLAAFAEGAWQATVVGHCNHSIGINGWKRVLHRILALPPFKASAFPVLTTNFLGLRLQNRRLQCGPRTPGRRRAGVGDSPPLCPSSPWHSLPGTSAPCHATHRDWLPASCS